MRRILLSFLLVWPLAAILLFRIFDGNLMASIFVFLGVPALVCSFFLRRTTILKVATLTAVIGIPLIIAVDYIAHLNGQWLLPASIVPFRLFHFVTIEMLAWMFLNVYAVIAFYKCFLDRTPDKKVPRPAMRRVALSSGAVLAVFLLWYLISPTEPKIPYFYAVVGIGPFLLPTIFELTRHPKLAGKFLVTAAYFFYLTMAYELSALRLGWWTFPGTQYIGWVSVGNLQFPLEEFLFWMFIFTVAVLSGYEMFDDGR